MDANQFDSWVPCDVSGGWYARHVESGKWYHFPSYARNINTGA